MTHGRPWSRFAVPAAIIALGLFGATAPTAHAGEWTIGSFVDELEPKEEEISGSSEKPFVLEIPWYATKISCSLVSVENAAIKPAGIQATLSISSCTMSGPPFVAETCKVIQPIELKTKGKLILHKGKSFVLFEALAEKGALATIKFSEGTECPLPLSNELKGSLVATTEAGSKVKQSLPLTSGLYALLSGEALKFGTHAASATSGLEVQLDGSHAGDKWGITVGGGAEGGPEFAITETFKDRSITTESIAATIGPGTIAATEIGLEIDCEGGTASGTVTQGGTAEVTATLSGCVLLEFGEVCPVYPTESETNLGELKVKGTGKLVLHAGEHYLTLSGSPLLSIYYGNPEECPITELSGPVSGSTAVKLPTALEATVSQPMTAIGLAAESLLGQHLPYKMSSSLYLMDGEASAYFTGVNEGYPWGAQ